MIFWSVTNTYLLYVPSKFKSLKANYIIIIVVVSDPRVPRSLSGFELVTIAGMRL